MDSSEVIMSSDESMLYTLSTFGDSSSEKAIMLFLNATDGALNGSPYYSGVTSCTEIYSFILSSSVFYSLLKCNGDFLISSVDKSTMKSTSFKINKTNVIAYSLTNELTTDRIIFVGQTPSLECYIGKVPRLGIYLHQDVSNSTDLSFTIFDNSTFYIGNENGAISAATSYTSGLHTGCSQAVFASNIGSNNTAKSKVSFIFNPISIPSVTAGNVGSTIINGSCSIDGTSYNSLLTLSNGSNYPDWISFNSVSNNFSWTSPLNANSSQLSFQNCVSDTSFPTKIGCTEILLNLDTSFVSEYDGSKILGFSIFSYAALAFVLVLCAALSAFNLSSMAVLWMMFGQMKICQMLLLQDGYVSEYVKRYILGFKFSLFNFAFLDFKNKIFVHLPGFSSLITWLDFTQENNKIGDLGYESGSAFINNINLFTTYAFTFVLHILVWILTKVLINCCKISRTRIFVRALILILKSFALGAYIRICIESTQGILITTISEIYLYDRSSTSKVGSFAISIVMFVFEIIIIIIIGVLCFCLKREPINNELNLRICGTYKNLFDELKHDLKQVLLARGYNFIDISRILLISILVICIGNHQIYCIVSIQLVYFITITAIRPFDRIHLNIIKIQNEAYFLIFSIYMIYFCTESRWNQSLSFTNEFIGKISDMKPPEALFILLMTINCGSTMAIAIMVLIISTCKKLCKKTKSVTSKPRPNNFARSNAILEENKSEDIYANSKNIESSKIGMHRQQIEIYHSNDRNILHS